MPIQLQSAAGTSANTQPLIFTTGTTGNLTIQFPATNGTVNQVLANDGSGVLTFATLSAAAPTGFTSAANGQLLAAGGTTNQSFAVVPRGTGSVLNMVPDNSALSRGLAPGDNNFKVSTSQASAALSTLGAQSIGLYFSVGAYSVASGVLSDININSNNRVIASGSNYGIAINCLDSGTGNVVPDSFSVCSAGSANNETRYFSFFGPTTSFNSQSATTASNAGAGPHIQLGKNSLGVPVGYDCILPTSSTLANHYVRYAAFGCVTTNSTTQYMLPNGATQTTLPVSDWGALPRPFVATGRIQGFCWGSVIAMTSGGAQYKIWRFYQLQDSAGQAQGAITVMANSAGAAGWTFANATTVGTTSVIFTATGGIVDTIRWFGSCWYLHQA